ncbi:hypothetical protein DITRI_Ditri11bG0017100 [Diplodiscus trichospermus]
MKQKHEKICPFAPCSCPISGCNFEGSSEQLFRHFGNEHKYSATRFRYGRSVPITLGIDEKLLVLREVTDGSLFILTNKVETLGNIVTLSRIGAPTENGFFYDLLAKTEGHESSSRCSYACGIMKIPQPSDPGIVIEEMNGNLANWVASAECQFTVSYMLLAIQFNDTVTVILLSHTTVNALFFDLHFTGKMMKRDKWVASNGGRNLAFIQIRC